MRSNLVLALLVAMPAIASALISDPLISNGGFETGDFSSWTLFTTEGGTIGTANVTLFDTANSGFPSRSASLQVGAVNPDGSTREGGGIFQHVFLGSGGAVSLSLNIAAYSQYPNIDGGELSLFFDGSEVATWNFGEMGSSGMTKYHTLSATLPSIANGDHEIRVLATRAYGASSYTPQQYIDNVGLSVTPIPEPNPYAFFSLGLLVMMQARRTKRA